MFEPVLTVNVSPDFSGSAYIAGSRFGPGLPVSSQRGVFQETKFDADGIMGATDVANHMPPGCIVMTQVKDGKLVRTSPKKAGTFDCNKKNLVEIKLDLS